MRKQISITLVVLACLSFGILAISAQRTTTPTKTTAVAVEAKINWMSMEDALKAHADSPKPLFIDIYTDWCHWCKEMDKQTFKDAQVINYLNDNFIAVKFNAEQRDPIEFKGKTYEFTPTGRRGIHLLAYKLLQQRASYPSFVVLDEQLNDLAILKGFQDKAKFMVNMRKIAAK